MWGLAAAATVLIAIGVSSRFGRGDGALVGRNAAAVTEKQTFTTAAGERRTLDLDDGISVTLGVASRLRVVSPGREVELEGEALFRVQHDEKRTFTVRAQGTVVRDVGTAFVVRAYPQTDGERVRVAVTEGAVALANSGGVTSVTVRAGEVARVGPDDSVTVRAGGSVATFVAWTEGKLVFDSATLTEVASELERWYGVRVRIASPSLAGRHYSSTFNGESLDDVLRVISLSLNLRVERSGNTITLRDASISSRSSHSAVVVARGL
jgi:ferric-dicitrate binding protein FerR (iron transport regulator)